MKSFLEMMEVDLKGRTSTRKGKDEAGKVVDLEYLSWSECKLILHEQGCKVVDFEPIANADGSYVFTHKQVTDKNGAANGCYFVKVKITIDELVFEYSYPLMNGNIVVRDETLNQLRISNAHARAFVKGVAVKTGLGYRLWLKEDETTRMAEDIGIHDIAKIQQRVGELLSDKLRKYGDEETVARAIGLKSAQLQQMLKWYDQLRILEEKLKAL